MSLISFLLSVDQIRYHRMRCLHLQFAKSLDQDHRSNLFVWSGLIWFQLIYANSLAPDQKYTMWGLMKVSFYELKSRGSVTQLLGQAIFILIFCSLGSKNRTHFNDVFCVCFFVRCFWQKLNKFCTRTEFRIPKGLRP